MPLLKTSIFCSLVMIVIVGAELDVRSLSSTHSCAEGAREEHRVCIFNDVLLFDGRLYYVASKKKVQVPRVRLSYLPVSEELDWFQPTVVTPGRLPPGLGQAEVVALTGPRDEAYLWSTPGGFNYGHQLGEFVPSLHATLCTHLGRCTADNTSGLRLFQYTPPPEEQAKAQAAAAAAGKAITPMRLSPLLDEATACFAEAPQRYLADATLKGKVLVLRRLLVGVGRECRARMFCNGGPNLGGFQPLSPQLFAGYRSRMAACLGFPAAAAAPMQPRLKIMMVDRRYSSGRSILNIGEVMEAVKRRYGGIADITLRYMDGLSVRAQAALWNQQSIAVLVHGAALGNWAFLPHGAAAVQVVTRPAGVVHDNEFALQLERDLLGVTNLSYFAANNEDAHYTHLKSEVVFKQPEWQSLKPKQKIAVLERGNCKVLGDPLKGHCLMWWLLKNGNVVLRPELLIDALDRAVEAVFAKRGLPLPPQDAEGAFLGRHGSEAGSGSSSSSRMGDGLPGPATGLAFQTEERNNRASSSQIGIREQHDNDGSSSSRGRVQTVQGPQSKHSQQLVASAGLLLVALLTLRRLQKHSHGQKRTLTAHL
ncbi:hypothetical protein ABPG75_006919 [Micractinium tetrahymenae]